MIGGLLFHVPVPFGEMLGDHPIPAGSNPLPCSGLEMKGEGWAASVTPGTLLIAIPSRPPTISKPVAR